MGFSPTGGAGRLGSVSALGFSGGGITGTVLLGWGVGEIWGGTVGLGVGEGLGFGTGAGVTGMEIVGDG